MNATICSILEHAVNGHVMEQSRDTRWEFEMIIFYCLRGEMPTAKVEWLHDISCKMIRIRKISEQRTMITDDNFEWQDALIEAAKGYGFDVQLEGSFFNGWN